MIDDNFSHNHKTNSPPIVEPRVAILVAGGSKKLLTAMRQIAKDTGTEVVVDVPMPMPMDAGVCRWKDRQRGLVKELEESRKYTVHAHDPDAKGKVAPVLTTLAVKFPLLSRRQRRAIQREISKAANKQSRN